MRCRCSILGSLILQLAIAQLAECLSSTAVSKGPKKRVEKVAIVGAGIAGLSLAHALRSVEKDLEISIFDSRKALDITAGSGG